MGFEQPKQYTPEEIAEMEKLRTISDAELLNDRAKYKFNDEENKHLEVTGEQIEKSRIEMENNQWPYNLEVAKTIEEQREEFIEGELEKNKNLIEMRQFPSDIAKTEAIEKIKLSAAKLFDSYVAKAKTEASTSPKETGSLEVGSNLRQQNKIIKILETGNLNIINEPEITLSQAERDSFLKKLQAGEISAETIDTLIENIQPPFGGEYGLQGLYGELLKNYDLQKAYEELLRAHIYPGGRIREGYHYQPEDMVRFFTKFPTPNDLESTLDQAIEKHEEELKTTTNKERAHVLKMDLMFRKQEQQSQVYEKLKAVLYGKRYEYWQQMKILKNEASL